MYKNKAILLLLLSMLSNQVSIYSHNNNTPLGNPLEESPFSYDYQYDGKDNDYNQSQRTGRDVNFYYAPRRPGTDDCSRWDRNYVRCY